MLKKIKLKLIQIDFRLIRILQLGLIDSFTALLLQTDQDSNDSNCFFYGYIFIYLEKYFNPFIIQFISNYRCILNKINLF